LGKTGSCSAFAGWVGFDRDLMREAVFSHPSLDPVQSGTKRRKGIQLFLATPTQAKCT
jgi:hypothetical protein